MMTIKVAKVPGAVVEVALESGATVAEAIEQAGVDAAGYEVRVNDLIVGMDYKLADGNKVYLVKQIKGNC